MPVYPGSKKPEIMKISSIGDEGFLEHNLNFSTHTGTHLDTPAHLIGKGMHITNYDISAFIGRAIKIECNSGPLIPLRIIEEALNTFPIPDFILLQTRWDTYWGKENYFHGFPVLDDGVAKFIAGFPLKGIGIDAISFDAVDDAELKNHNVLLKKNFLLIENLCNLYQLPHREFWFSCLPLKIKAADGSPVRAIGIIDDYENAATLH
jgi:arylformamidase